MSHLIFDIGNSRVKAAVMERGNLCELLYAASLEELDIEGLCRRYRFDGAVASVVGRQADFEHCLPAELFQSFHLMSCHSKLPLQIVYDTPQTLGMDRVAAAIGAQQHQPRQNLLVVDAGSCITVDFLDAQGVWHGGAIMPGLQMRYKAMHQFTAALPLLTFDRQRRSEKPVGTPSSLPLTGGDTEMSMRVGVETAAVIEIEGFMQRYKQRFGEIKLFLTGGDADFFANHINFPNFALSNLVLEGLDKILEMNM